MKDYNLTEQTINGITYYYTTFIDGEGKEQVVEIDREVYDTLNQSQQRTSSQERKDRRYGLCPFDDTLGGIMSADDSEQTRELIKAVREHMESLTEVQRRRLHLYFDKGLTIKQVAKKEGACFSSVRESLAAAVDILRSKKYF